MYKAAGLSIAPRRVGVIKIVINCNLIRFSKVIACNCNLDISSSTTIELQGQTLE